MTEPENPYHDDDLSGDYARDSHRGGLGDDYAREKPEEDKEEEEEDLMIMNPIIMILFQDVMVIEKQTVLCFILIDIHWLNVE